MPASFRPPVRVAIVTLDNHLKGAVERADAELSAENIHLSLHAASDWDGDAGAIIRHSSAGVVDKYDSMAQTLAPRTANSITANGFGGFDEDARPLRRPSPRKPCRVVKSWRRRSASTTSPGSICALRRS